MTSRGGRRRKCEVLNLGGSTKLTFRPCGLIRHYGCPKDRREVAERPLNNTRRVNRSMNNDSMKQIGGTVATKLPLASLNKRTALLRGPYAKNRQKPALYSILPRGEAKRLGPKTTPIEFCYWRRVPYT